MSREESFLVRGGTSLSGEIAVAGAKNSVLKLMAVALMAEGRSNQAIGDRLGMARKTVEAHIANIFSKLELEPASDDHRRVLAVLAHLRGPG